MKRIKVGNAFRDVEQNDNKMKDWRKRVSFCIRLMILILGIVCLFSGFKRNGELSNYKEKQTLDDFIMYPESKITHNFMCQGKGLQSIVLYVTNAYEGAITVSITDENGTLMQEPYAFELEAFQSDMLTLPYNLEFETELGKRYTLNISCSDINTENAPRIKSFSSIMSATRFNDKNLQREICITGVYEYYYDFSGMLWVFFCVVLIAIFGLAEFRLGKEKYLIAQEIMLVVIAIGSFIIIDCVNYKGDAQSPWRIFINVVPIYILERLIFTITNSLKVTGILASVLSFVLSVANYYVCLFRGRPIMPWDLDAIGTATTVASVYTFEAIIEIIWAFLIMMLMIQLSFLIRCKEKNRRTVKNVLRFVCVNGLIMLCCFMGYKGLVYPRLTGDLWAMEDVYENNGVVAGFIAQSKFADYSKPEGYSQEKVDQILSEVEIQEADKEKVTAENIIVIMNESFADFRTIGDNAIKGDYMPYIDSLSGNVLKGNLYVSTYGGGTANTEYEALTGNSSVYVPGIPYQTFIDKETESLASILKEESYDTQAFHPYMAENWNRNEVYPLMGFDTFRSIDDMKVSDEDYVRWCVSDYKDYKEIIKTYKKKKKDKFFMFNVTMQNHGGYADEFENFSNTVDLSEYGDFKQAETYLSLMKESDKQLKVLIDYFSKVEEPTLICFFGDHYPNVEEEFFEMLYGKEIEDLTPQEQQERFITPVVLWSNYEMESVDIEKISANYLSALILKQANITMSPYDSWLWKLFQEYPVISSAGIWDKKGNYTQSADSKLLKQYGWLQYDRVKK